MIFLANGLKCSLHTKFYTITDKKKAGTVVFTTDRQSKRIARQEKSNLPIDEVSLATRGEINGDIRLSPHKLPSKLLTKFNHDIL